AVDLEYIQDPYHIGVVQPRDRPSLAHGPLVHLALVGAAQARRRYQFLDRDIAAQRLVVSQPDPAHAALTTGTDKPVPAGATPRRMLITVAPLFQVHERISVGLDDRLSHRPDSFG